MDEHVQTKVPERMADRIEKFQEGDYMTESEALRQLLRDGLDANEPLDKDPDADEEPGTDKESETNGNQSDATAIIEGGYRFTRHLTDAGAAAGIAALGAWMAVTFTAIPLNFGAMVATVTLVVMAVVLSIVGLAFALGLRAAEAIAGTDADPQLRRLDLRRVIAS